MCCCPQVNVFLHTRPGHCREGGREVETEGGREGWEDAVRELGRQRGRAGEWEGVSTGHRELVSQGEREVGRDWQESVLHPGLTSNTLH